MLKSNFFPLSWNCPRTQDQVIGALRGLFSCRALQDTNVDICKVDQRSKTPRPPASAWASCRSRCETLGHRRRFQASFRFWDDRSRRQNKQVTICIQSCNQFKDGDLSGLSTKVASIWSGCFFDGYRLLLKNSNSFDDRAALQPPIEAQGSVHLMHCRNLLIFDAIKDLLSNLYIFQDTIFYPYLSCKARI